MLNSKVRAALADAISALRDGDAGAWQALAPLSRIGAEGTDAMIDFTTEASLGAPVIILRPQANRALPLTARQNDVARLVARGMPNKAIARDLGISPATVKDHVHAILSATGVSSRAALIVLIHGGMASTGRA